VKLALLAAVGVVSTHAIHLIVGTRIATRSLAREQESLGRGIARLVAAEAADPILTDDTVTLAALVARAVAANGAAYCFVLRGDGTPVATSFRGGTPEALVHLRRGAPPGPLVVVDGEQRFLDLEEPILGGRAGVVRLGLGLDVLQATRRDIAAPLGVLAVIMTLLGFGAAVLIGRSVARRLDDLVAAADRFDPTAPVAPVTPRGGPEMATLADRFNRMMDRLRAEHEERERVRAQALANARLASLGAVVAGVAHEVKNPLASLKACVTLLREDADPAQRAADLGMMDEALDRLVDVVRRLLDLASPRPAALAATPLLDLAREAPRLAALSLRGKGIALDEVVEREAADAWVLADRKQIGQAVLNLLLNAAYVTREGGRVGVRVRAAGERRGISVEDDGPGIPPDLRERVLEPFFTTKPAGEGTGLGLALTRTIVVQHGGSLELEFPEGGGTVATIWLPAARPPDATGQRSASADRRRPG
jgi:signal transduction histidine kinase